MNLTLDIPNKVLSKAQFRTEYMNGQFTVILTLLNRLEQKPSVKWKKKDIFNF